MTTTTTINVKINEIKNKIPNITNIAVENEIPNVSNLIKKLTIIQKLVKLNIKLLLIMITLKILLLKNLICKHQKILLQD